VNGQRWAKQFSVAHLPLLRVLGERCAAVEYESREKWVMLHHAFYPHLHRLSMRVRRLLPWVGARSVGCTQAPIEWRYPFADILLWRFKAQEELRIEEVSPSPSSSTFSG